MSRRFTGFHMATILIAFFGIVIAVNLVMARYATGTFGGTVVDNSYVAGQSYNKWLAQADRQKALGWDVEMSLDKARHLRLVVTRKGEAQTGLTAQAIASHPLGRADEINLAFVAGAPGALVSLRTLPAGRWKIRAELARDGQLYQLAGEVR